LVSANRVLADVTVKENKDMSVKVYNPTSGPAARTIAMAPRPDTLDHSVLGVIDNGKLHADAVLDRITKGLKERYQLKDVIRLNKESISHSIKNDEAQRLAAQCDIALAGVGD
jgi:hypothetical protein